MKKGMSGHHSAIMKSDEWLTPPEILSALGEFDLDPCAPLFRPWPTAKHHFTIEDNGLIQQWFGRVWMNPPYGKVLGSWLERLARHGNGIALTFARTDTEAFQRHVFPKADSLLFIEGRLNFYTVAGTRSKMNSGAPSILIAYGERNVEALEESCIKGKHLFLNSVPMIVVGISPTWKSVVSIALTRIKGEAYLQQVYDIIERIAPDKTHKNKFYKEKVRQVLQQHFTKVKRGCYVIDLNNEEKLTA
jgi:hypothetical protein